MKDFHRAAPRYPQDFRWKIYNSTILVLMEKKNFDEININANIKLNNLETKLKDRNITIDLEKLNYKTI